MTTFFLCLASFIGGASVGVLLASLACAAKTGDEKVRRVDMEV